MIGLDDKTIVRLTRNRDMWRAWLAGETPTSLATRFGITRWRCSYLVYRMNRRLRYILKPDGIRPDWGATGLDYPERRRAFETALMIDEMVFVFGPGEILKDVYVDGEGHNETRRRLNWEELF